MIDEEDPKTYNDSA